MRREPLKCTGEFEHAHYISRYLYILIRNDEMFSVHCLCRYNGLRTFFVVVGVIINIVQQSIDTNKYFTKYEIITKCCQFAQ